MTLQFDLLQELLDALAQQGAHYGLVVEAPQFAFGPNPGLIPPSTFRCAQVQNNIAILARTDRPPAEFQLSNVQSAQFKNQRIVATPLGLLPAPRAWASVDVTFHGKAFRFIGTHLESFIASVRELQGAELRNGPANTSLPVIVAMDSNAQAFPLPQDPTYMDFIAAGYNDVWSELFPLAPGFTWGQAPLVNNPVSQLTRRIDLILTLGNVEAKRIALFGADPSSMTPSGLWPSDHAGVAARLKVEGVEDQDEE
jgi:endonuclease/exonuclease/phosphatase family metal-dependent hydrolase